MPKALEIAGQKFGQLTVIRREGSTKQGATWLCLCDCGKECIAIGKLLRYGTITDCGHLPTHCRRGHEFTPENSYRITSGPRKGQRHCRACKSVNRNAQKLSVLTHYSSNNILCCSWEGCNITDIDMLTLDHTEDSGAEHRREIKISGGTHMYGWIVTNGFPEGFQTLCGGHQFKKEIMKYREIRGY